MLTKPWLRCFILLFSGMLLLASEPDPDIPLIGPGNPSLKTEKLQFPRSVYYIRVKNPAGEWLTQGTFTERGKDSDTHGAGVFERIQMQTFNDGKSYLSHTSVFDKKTLKPLATVRRSQLSKYPPGFVKAFDLEYRDGKLAGTWEKEGEARAEYPAKPMDQVMFEGDVTGVVIAALPLKLGYKAKLPVMFSQMGTAYTVVARVVGNKDFKTDGGKTVRTWAVETDWHDHASGQVSPGGGSGGTYYVTTDPPKGYPHVFKYINDNFDTELIPQMSPRPAELKP